MCCYHILNPSHVSCRTNFAPRAAAATPMNMDVTLKSTHTCVPQSYKFPLRKTHQENMAACSYLIRPKRVSYRKSKDLFPNGAMNPKYIYVAKPRAESRKGPITLGPVAPWYRRASAIDGRQAMILSNHGRANNTRQMARLGCFIFRAGIW